MAFLPALGFVFAPRRGEPYLHLMNRDDRRTNEMEPFTFLSGTMMPRLSVLLLLAVLLPCCSPYSADFAAAVDAAEVPRTKPTGPWKGRWLSKHNGHEGPLWCLVFPTPDTPGSYDFRYRAGWGMIHFGDYTHPTPLQVQADGSFTLRSAMKLPGDLGTYQVDGSLTPTTFIARYTADTGDHGTMSLKRP
jgi:hypothetical protein